MFVLGDFEAGDTIYFPFDTYDSNGASVTITGLAVTDIEVYKDGSVTQRASDNGYTLLDTDGIDFDGSTGLHGFSIDTSDNSDSGFWSAGSQYWIHVNAITVDGQTVRFTYYLTLGRLLKPTTAGRKIDVTSGGAAGIDWGNVENPTTTVGLSGTTVKTATDVETDTADIQSRLPAALTGAGNMKADVLAISGDTTAADNLEAWMDAATTGTATGSPTTTSIPVSGFTEATADHFNGMVMVFTSGACAKQARPIIDYVGDPGQVVTVYPAFTDAPSSGDAFIIAPVTNFSNVRAISDDTAAADNAESAFDGTGFNVGAGNIVAAGVSGAVGSVTGNVGGNVTGSVGSLATQAKADVNAEVDAALGDYDSPTKAELDSGLAALNDLDAAGIRTAVGLGSANLDTQLGDLPTATENAAALLDLTDGIQTGLTLRQAQRVQFDAAASKTNGGGTTTFNIRDKADSKNRVSATVDGDGNRTAVTLDLT